MKPAAQQPLIILGVGVITALVVAVLTPALAEPPAEVVPRKIQPNAQQSIVAKNRKTLAEPSPSDAVRPGDIIDPGGQSGQCELTPAELLLVSNIRVTLKSLANREARVASREAALQALQANIREDLAELKRLRESVDARVSQVERYQLRIDRMRDSERKMDGLASRTAKSLEELANAEKQKAENEANNAASGQVPEWQAERIQQLAGILKKMKPAEAAPILARQSDAVAVGALDALGSRAAGKVLAQMPAERAGILAQKLVAQPASKKNGGAK